MPETNQWVSTRERMPTEFGRKYLIFHRHDELQLAYFDGKHWWDHEDSDYEYMSSVLFWMDVELPRRIYDRQ
jgi:hypothetical protein